MQAPKSTNCGIVTSIEIEISKFRRKNVRISFASNHLRCPFQKITHLTNN